MQKNLFSRSGPHRCKRICPHGLGRTVARGFDALATFRKMCLSRSGPHRSTRRRCNLVSQGLGRTAAQDFDEHGFSRSGPHRCKRICSRGLGRTVAQGFEALTTFRKTCLSRSGPHRGTSLRCNIFRKGWAAPLRKTSMSMVVSRSGSHRCKSQGLGLTVAQGFDEHGFQWLGRTVAKEFVLMVWASPLHETSMH